MRDLTKAAALCEQFEGCKLSAYLCPAHIPTIGFGHTQGVSMGVTCTLEQAQVWLAQDLAIAAAAVERHVKVTLNDNQFQALVSFTFNLGEKALANSKLLKDTNTGDFAGAAAQFELWVHADGKVLPGLVTRRAAERALFEAGV